MMQIAKVSGMVVIGFCLAFGSFLPVLAEKGNVGLYIKSSEPQIASWLESAWMDSLGDRFSPADQALGGNQQADEAVKKAEGAMREGKKAFDELNPEIADKKFNEAVKLLREAAPYKKDYSLLSRALLYLGIGALTNGKKEDGRKAFLEALYYTPNAKLTGITTEADKLTLFNEVKKQADARPSMLVTLSSPQGGSVYVNGEYKGTSPLKISLKEGNNVITFYKEGYARWGKDVVVRSNGQVIVANLKALPIYAKWKASGDKAISQIQDKEVAASVDGFAKLLGVSKLLLANVINENGKTYLEVAAYNLATKQKLAYGKTSIAFPEGVEKAKKLALDLLNGISPKKTQLVLENPTKAPAKSNKALAIGLGVGIGAAVLIGGGVGLYFLLRPCKNGACARITMSPAK